MTTTRVKQVLMVDDDPAYTDLVERALTSCQPLCRLKGLLSGADLWEWLATHKRPGLILLDINLVGVSGLDILKRLKTTEHYKPIPVLMLTVSEHLQDFSNAYEIGAEGYIQKPTSFTDLSACLRSVTRYWFESGGRPGYGSAPEGFSSN